MTNAETFEKIFGFDINKLFAWDNEEYYEWADASAEPPKLKGYSVEHLMFVAALLANNYISPDNLASVMNDVGRMVDILREEMETNLRNTLNAAMSMGEQK